MCDCRESNLTSMNHFVIKTICVETWKAMNCCDAPNVGLNPLGSLLIKNRPTRFNTRAAKSGSLLPPAKRQISAFAWWAYTCWNLSSSLRSAPTLSAAKKAASELAVASPL